MSAAQTPWYGIGSSFGVSAAEAYEQCLAPAIFTPWAQDLVEFAVPANGGRVLDVACGTGVVARAAGSRIGSVGTVVGLDRNASVLEVARSLPWNAPATVQWQEANVIDLPFEDGSFDLVLCQQGLQFFPDRPAALLEMHRVLTPSGRVALSVWRPIQYSPGFESLHNALTRRVGADAGILGPFALGDADELRSLVGGAGFRDVDIRQATKMLEFPSVEDFVWRYVAASPIATIMAHIDGDVRATIVDDVADDLKESTNVSGLAFPIESHLVLAHARAKGHV